MKGEKSKGYVDLCFVDMDMYINRFKFIWFNNYSISCELCCSYNKVM